MKYKNKILKCVFFALAGMCWWMILYPEFIYNQDTVRKIDPVSGKEVEFDYEELGKARSDQMRVESRLLALLSKEKEH